MDEYIKELNSIYSMSREAAALLMVCKRLDRIADKLATLERKSAIADENKQKTARKEVDL